MIIEIGIYVCINVSVFFSDVKSQSLEEKKCCTFMHEYIDSTFTGALFTLHNLSLEEFTG